MQSGNPLWWLLKEKATKMAEKIETSVISEETLKSQTTDLTDEQKDAIREEVVKEFEKPDDEEPIAEKTDDDEAPESDDEDKETPEAKTAREEKERKDADDVLLKKPETELSDEEKTRKADLVKQKEESEIAEESKSLALEKKISVEDAKKELESYKKISEKYKNNPKEMAKALLNSQREFLKLQQEHNKLKDEPRPSELKEGEAIVDGKKLSKEEVRTILVEGYRKEYPDIAEEMDDDKVYKLAVTRLKDKQSAMWESEQKELSGKAIEKRSQLLGSLTETEKEYSDQIKGLLEQTSNQVLMHPDWSFEDVKSWARGRYFTPEKLEELRTESFKKGAEEAKILGVKEREQKGSTNGKTPPAKKAVASQLTEDEKEQALSMYRMDGISDEQKFEMFIDYKKHQKEINKNRGM